MKNTILITIDGLAASGKSTYAKKLCNITKYTHLSTGSAHRLNTWNILNKGINISNSDELDKYLSSLKFNFLIENNSLVPHLEGVSVSHDELYSSEVINFLPKVTRIPAVCLKLTEIFREIVKDKNIIAEGHGLGTGIFPNADIKFFCTAPLEIRAKRRWLELSGKNHETLEAIQSKIENRDSSDENREINPVRITKDMHIIDTYKDSTDVCIDKMLKIINL